MKVQFITWSFDEKLDQVEAHTTGMWHVELEERDERLYKIG